MKELYWVKVKRNNLPAFKFDKHLQSIKEALKNNYPERRWLVTSDDIDIHSLNENTQSSIFPTNIPLEAGVVAYDSMSGDRTIQPLNALQEALLESYKKPEPSLWVSSRQSGLTTFLAEVAIEHALNADYLPTKILVLSDRMAQAEDIRMKMLDLLSIKYPDIKLLINNKSQVQLDNGTIIIFSSARSAVNSIKGMSYSLIVADLVSFYHNTFFEEFFQAVIPLFNAKIVLASTSLAGSNKDFTKAAITKKYKNVEFDVVRMSAVDIAFLENRQLKDSVIRMKEYVSEDRYNSEILVQPNI